MLTSWPPSTSPVRTSVPRPSRAAVTAADMPATPPPAINRSTSFAKLFAPLRTNVCLSFDLDRRPALFGVTDERCGRIAGIANGAKHRFAALGRDGDQKSA